MSKTRETVTNILSKASSVDAAAPKKLSTKNLKMAAKVQLMKLKQNSDGNKSIIAEDRIYFRVHFPSKKSDRILSKNVFVSKKWSTGKIIDALAELCQIENPNNSSNSEKKLRIFRQIDGDIWSIDLTASLESMLDADKAFNGESIVLEYTSNPEMLPAEIFEPYRALKWFLGLGNLGMLAPFIPLIDTLKFVVKINTNEAGTLYFSLNLAKMTFKVLNITSKWINSLSLFYILAVNFYSILSCVLKVINSLDEHLVHSVKWNLTCRINTITCQRLLEIGDVVFVLKLILSNAKQFLCVQISLPI